MFILEAPRCWTRSGRERGRVLVVLWFTAWIWLVDCGTEALEETKAGHS